MSFSVTRCLAVRALALCLTLGVGLMLGVSPAEGGEVPFANQLVVSNQATGTQVVAYADVDGDGDNDLISAWASPTSVVWYENVGGIGSTWTAHTIATSTNAGQFASPADVDGDGDIDVITALTSTGFAWQENMNGNGLAWTRHFIATDGSGADSAVAGDIDGDTFTDIVTATRGRKITWQRNDHTPRDGGWTATTVYSTTATLRSVQVGDFDGDHDTDICAVATNDNKALWFRNDNGNGSAWTTIPISTSVVGPYSVWPADIDKNGTMDFAVASTNDDRVSVYLNLTGDGLGFLEVPVSVTANGANSVRSGDIDKDGDIDLVGTSVVDSRVTWYENTSGAGTNWDARDLPPSVLQPYGIQAVDLDGDGDLEIVSASSGDSKIAVYPNRLHHRGAAFPFASQISGGLNGASAVVTGDFNSNGIPDLYACSYQDDRATTFVGNVVGGSVSWVSFILTGGANGATAVATGDIDGDLNLDVLVGSENDEKVRMFSNFGGTGLQWVPAATLTNVGPVSGVATADLDKDLDQDVVVASAFLNKVSWFSNDTLTTATANGTIWTEHPLSLGVTNPLAIRVADIDGDGDTDVITAAGTTSPLTGSIVWHENVDPANNTWTDHVLTTAVSAPQGFIITDLDKNGDLDIVVASTRSNSIVLLTNEGGAASWTVSTLATGINLISGVDAADFDSDGDIDLVSTALGANTLQWHQRTGATWATQPIASGLQGPKGVVAADFDNDSKPDIALISESGDYISWYRNEGGQYGLNATSIAPASIGEGKIDSVLKLTLANRGQGTDSPVGLDTIALYIDDGIGTAVSPEIAAAFFASLQIYRDTGSGVFEPGTDILVGAADLSTFDQGSIYIVCDEQDPNAQALPGETVTFFFTAELTPTAFGQAFTQFRVTIYPPPYSRALPSQFPGILLEAEGAAVVTTTTILPALVTSGRAAGDFDNSGCTDLSDFLILLDYWQQELDGTVVALEDFLALVDNWQLGDGC